MKDCAKFPPLAPAFDKQMFGALCLSHSLSAEDTAPVSWPSPSGGVLHNRYSASAPRKAQAASIYVVDDSEFLTALYTIFLKGTGYVVRTFNSRAEALAALTVDRKKPDLLIMDYLGDSLPADRFMQRCLVVHPSLRILMASGLNQSDVRFSGVRPDRFLQKPFTAHEFLQEIRAALINS